MRKLVIVMLVGLGLPFCVNAQLARQMSKYHEKNGITVTQLDKSLYGLYQKENLSPDIEVLLQNLEEVNILNADTKVCTPELVDKITAQFRETLDHSNKYKLIKSHSTPSGKQLIYTQNKNGKVSTLVVWNQSPERLDVIELKGNIQPDKIALLSRALNLKGLNSLAELSSNTEPAEAFSSDDFYDPDMDRINREMQKRAENMFEKFSKGFGNTMGGFFQNPGDSTDFLGNFFGSFGDLFSMEDFFGEEGLSPAEMEKFFKNQENTQQKMEKFFQSFGDGNNMMSSSVQVTEENGKTKIKIDSKNSDMTYVIDGKQAPKDSVQMPEGILNVNIIPSKEDIKKSYLFITSKDKLGTFMSYKDGILKFRYKNQEYNYNLDKANVPLLVIDGRLETDFAIDPEEILQIRPLSPIEKEIGYYPTAEVIINTK